MKIIKNNRNQCEKLDNYEILRNTIENHNNHANPRNPLETI